MSASAWYAVKTTDRGQLKIEPADLVNAADMTPEQLEDFLEYALDQLGCPLPVTERLASEAKYAVEEALERRRT